MCSIARLVAVVMAVATFASFAVAADRRVVPVAAAGAEKNDEFGVDRFFRQAKRLLGFFIEMLGRGKDAG
jgi:hypothetical protein